jgi:hypothetical protein
MSDMFKQAKKDRKIGPLMKIRKYRDSYVEKIKSIPIEHLRDMKRPIQVLNYVPQVPSQALGFSATDLGQSLVRTTGFNPRKTVYEDSRM